jgi:hypothetical protein
MSNNIIRIGVSASPEETRKGLLYDCINREGGNPSMLLELLAVVVESED